MKYENNLIVRGFCSPSHYNEGGGGGGGRGDFFHKKPLHGGANLFGQFFWGMFYMETNYQIMQGRKLMVKWFQRSIQVSFPSH